MTQTLTITNLTDSQIDRLGEILDQAWRSSVNHLVSSVQATQDNPTGKWAMSAPRLAAQVEDDRMLNLQVRRATMGVAS